jgi:hypothetical protein
VIGILPLVANETIGATHLEMWWPRRRHCEVEGAALCRDETRRFVLDELFPDAPLDYPKPLALLLTGELVTLHRCYYPPKEYGFELVAKRLMVG